MDNFYQHGLPQPFHISVGAVLFTDTFEICTHHFIASEVPEQYRFLLGGLPHAYYLMRESLEGDESLQTGVKRGIYEEFGATGRVEKYLGSLTSEITGPNETFQKLTIYHAVHVESLGERPAIDGESKSLMEWYPAHDLLELYEKQARNTDRPELNETEIIKRFINAYGL